ncbi:MAG: hypothetical protein LUI87_18415, partial [Lachnospiraceae bacterium]|nr:hypothetical protein [Lachnospiraceae bacterium]
VQEAIDLLNEGIENEEEQYSLNIVILDEDGNPVELQTDGSSFEGYELLTLFSDAVFVAKDSLELVESSDGVTYTYGENATFMAENVNANEHVATASAAGETEDETEAETEAAAESESATAHLYQATFPAPDVIRNVNDYEWETLYLLQYDPSTATFYRIPLSADMYNEETGDLTVDFPCTGSFTLVQDMVRLSELVAEAAEE